MDSSGRCWSELWRLFWVVGVVAGGVSYNRLERIAIDMSTDEESLSQAEKGLPYQQVNARGLIGGLFRKLRITGKSA